MLVELKVLGSLPRKLWRILQYLGTVSRLIMQMKFIRLATPR